MREIIMLLISFAGRPKALLVSYFIGVLLSWASAAALNLAGRAVTAGTSHISSEMSLTMGLQATTDHHVECFNTVDHNVGTTIAEDCDVVINQVILQLYDPFKKQIFGFDQTADVDLSSPQDHSWAYGHCVISVWTTRRTEQDKFSMVDVAVVAQAIIGECVTGTKDALGGHGFIGSLDKNFFVIVGETRGLRSTTPGNSTRLSLPFNHTTDIARDDFRSLEPEPRTSPGNSTDLTSTGSPGLNIACTKPGMPAAGKINHKDCLAATEKLLRLPDILIPQDFTTEETGGVEVPDVHQSNYCYLTINTGSNLSKSSTFAYIKVAYYASEIMRRCPIGGVAKLTPGPYGFYVSLTGSSPIYEQSKIDELLYSANLGLAGENLSMNTTDMSYA